MILSIETSTDVCSVALSAQGETVSHLELFGGNAHAANLTPLIEQLMSEAGASMAALDAVAVSCGPGSYTGLRIGVSTAKGICYALQKPLIAVDTLRLMAEAIFLSDPTIECAAPMIDARRMEVYTAAFVRKGEVILPVEAMIVDESSYLSLLDSRKIAFGGNGAEKCKATITHENAQFIDNIFPLAQNMARLANEKFAKGEFENVAYFEPFYLKEFVATVAKNKVL